MKNLELKIVNDCTPMNPREEFDNVFTLALKAHYGDEELNDPIEFLVQLLDWDDEKWERTQERLNWSPWVCANEEVMLNHLLKQAEKKFIISKVYAYDHSGISLSSSPFSCRWDSGLIGFAYVEKEEVRNEQNWTNISPKRKTIIDNILNGELNTLTQYLNGDVYGFEVIKSGEVIDSCYGFYGTDWNNNGLKDYIPQELENKLETIEISYAA